MSKARFSQRWLESHRVQLHGFERTDVVGIGHAMAEVESLLARLREPERAKALGAVPPRGILFHGGPGTGKTLLARYLAASLGTDVPLYEVGSDELSPDRLRRGIAWLAHEFRRSVLFVDEADSWAVNRSFMQHSPATRLVLTAALNALDGLVPTSGPVVVVASNRHPTELDPALVRAGRLGIHVAFDLPDEDERVALFELFLAGRPIDPSVDVRRAARLTRGVSPADLRGYVDDAAGLALAAGRDAITNTDLIDAVRRAGQVLPDPAEHNPARRWRVAVHEASHVAVATVLRGAGWVSSVRLDQTGGRTALGAEDVLDSDRPDDEVRDLLTTSAAGSAGEVVILGEGTLCGEEDVAIATRFAVRRIVAGIDPTLPGVDVDMLGRNVSEGLKHRLGERVADLSAAARARATAIVEANVDAIVAFATTLERAGELTGDDLTSAIEAADFQATPESAA